MHNAAGNSYGNPHGGLERCAALAAALTQAARESLAARWHHTLEALEAAWLEHRALHAAALTDVRAVRKAAQRVHDLEQLRAVLAPELDAAGVSRYRREHQSPGDIATTPI